MDTRQQLSEKQITDESDSFEIEHDESLVNVPNFLKPEQNPSLYSDSFLKGLSLIRSARRKKLHVDRFWCQPQTHYSLPSTLKNSPKLIRVILQLTLSQAIISPIQYHWTTKENLINIIKHNHFYSNTLLKRFGINFQPNCFAKVDEANGDGNVICLTPYLVDYAAFYDFIKKQLKTGSVRLSLDINKIKVIGKFNQFFKLFDFECPLFHYEIRVTDQLTIIVRKFENIDRANNKWIEFKLGNKYCIIAYRGDTFEKANSIIYGNLYMINRFCLLKLLKDLEKEDLNFANTFVSYLNSLPEAIAKKVFVVLAQSLTIFSEFNFNAAIQLAAHLFTEIHVVNEETTYFLSNSSQEVYLSMIRNIANNEKISPSIPFRKEVIVTADNNQPTDKKEKSCTIYGNKVSIGMTLLSNSFYHINDQDLSQINLEHFGNYYYETRPK